MLFYIRPFEHKQKLCSTCPCFKALPQQQYLMNCTSSVMKSSWPLSSMKCTHTYTERMMNVIIIILLQVICTPRRSDFSHLLEILSKVAILCKELTHKEVSLPLCEVYSWSIQAWSEVVFILGHELSRNGVCIENKKSYDFGALILSQLSTLQCFCSPSCWCLFFLCLRANRNMICLSTASWRWGLFRPNPWPPQKKLL